MLEKGYVTSATDILPKICHKYDIWITSHTKDQLSYKIVVSMTVHICLPHNL